MAAQRPFPTQEGFSSSPFSDVVPESIHPPPAQVTEAPEEGEPLTPLAMPNQQPEQEGARAALTSSVVTGATVPTSPPDPAQAEAHPETQPQQPMSEGRGVYVYASQGPAHSHGIDTLPTHTHDGNGHVDPERQKICCCFVCISLIIVVVLLGLLFVLFLIPYPLYATHLQGSMVCTTAYILPPDSVQCGQINSWQHSGMKINGWKKDGDTLREPLKVWLIHERNLKLYSRSEPTAPDGAYLPEHKHVLLNGWDIYTWKDSIISGYCCISNNGSVEKTAHFYIFSNDEDLQSFTSGEAARNAILSDTITIPPNGTKCFEKWGAKHPFTVKDSSYYFMGVDIPADMTFSSNITVSQTYVNTSDYGNPHYISYSNSTHFKLHNTFLHQDKYIAICEAQKNNIVSGSLHLHSCNEPHHWRNIFIILLSVGCIGLSAVVAFTLIVCHQYRHRKHWYKCICSDRCCRQPIDCYQQHADYEQINN